MRFLILLFIGVGMYEINVWQLVFHFTDHIELAEDGNKNTIGVYWLKWRNIRCVSCDMY
jgi:hypothetical protein